MYILTAADTVALVDHALLFDQHMEPLLTKLEQYLRSHDDGSPMPELTQYLQVCRWPFRQLEYSFALDALTAHLHRGDNYLDAGSGVTPLAHVFAGRGIGAAACDIDASLIARLRQLRPESIYGSHVTYSAQDLTRLSYADGTFHAISCISVLEHIPAPHDKEAVRELFRVLKPSGILVLTVDFEPGTSHQAGSRMRHLVKRSLDLARHGKFLDIWRGFVRKLDAHRTVAQGQARQPRSAHECFRIEHLEQDLLPLAQGHDEITSGLAFSMDLRSVSPADAYCFWNLVPGLYQLQGRRNVLPAAWILRKSSSSVVTSARADVA